MAPKKPDADRHQRAQERVGDFLAAFKEYPPRQKAASFTIVQVMQKLRAGRAGGGK